MIYGYLRVSSDEQDVNSQRQGVDKFAADRGWTIEQYITDEGVSGGKDPDKRNLGPMLRGLRRDDIIICSEISRLGRDLYMVMDILHHCMEVGCVIYTVKDRFVLGDDIQSKVLAFAFGLSAEIERQMIRQRTKEGLRLRMRMGVLLGRPLTKSDAGDGHLKLAPVKDAVLEQYRWGVSIRRLAQNFDVDRNTMARFLAVAGAYDINPDDATLRRERVKLERERRRTEAQRKRERQNLAYKDDDFKVVPLDRQRMRDLIARDLTLPEIAQAMPEYSYEQLYDTVLCDEEYNRLYRQHGQLRLVKRNQKKQRRGGSIVHYGAYNECQTKD